MKSKGLLPFKWPARPRRIRRSWRDFGAAALSVTWWRLQPPRLDDAGLFGAGGDPSPPPPRRGPYVRVEHVHVSDGGQAAIGNVKTAGSGDAARGPALTPRANARPYAAEDPAGAPEHSAKPNDAEMILAPHRQTFPSHAVRITPGCPEPATAPRRVYVFVNRFALSLSGAG
jgi:hypothetical protein